MIVVSAKGLTPDGCDEITAKVFPSSEMSALWTRDWYRSVLVKTAPDLRFARYTFRGLSATGKDGHNGNSVGIFQFRCFAPGVGSLYIQRLFRLCPGFVGLVCCISIRPGLSQWAFYLLLPNVPGVFGIVLLLPWLLCASIWCLDRMGLL